MQPDPLLPLMSAAFLFARPPSKSTLLRWARDGYKGNKLRTERQGHFLYTRASWVEQFKTACNSEFSATAERELQILHEVHGI